MKNGSLIVSNPTRSQPLFIKSHTQRAEQYGATPKFPVVQPKKTSTKHGGQCFIGVGLVIFIESVAATSPARARNLPSRPSSLEHTDMYCPCGGRSSGFFPFSNTKLISLCIVLTSVRKSCGFELESTNISVEYGILNEPMLVLAVNFAVCVRKTV